jgi:hypothetical protein
LREDTEIRVLFLRLRLVNIMFPRLFFVVALSHGSIVYISGGSLALVVLLLLLLLVVMVVLVVLLVVVVLPPLMLSFAADLALNLTFAYHVCMSHNSLDA